MKMCQKKQIVFRPYYKRLMLLSSFDVDNAMILFRNWSLFNAYILFHQVKKAILTSPTCTTLRSQRLVMVLLHILMLRMRRPGNHSIKVVRLVVATRRLLPWGVQKIPGKVGRMRPRPHPDLSWQLRCEKW